MFSHGVGCKTCLEIIQPAERDNPSYRLLICQIHIRMLVDSTATSTVHYYLLTFIYGEKPFSVRQIVLTWNRVELDTRNFKCHFRTGDRRLQVSQIIMDIVDQKHYLVIISQIQVVSEICTSQRQHFFTDSSVLTNLQQRTL